MPSELDPSHDHAVLVYESEAEMLATVLSCVERALASGMKCVYVGSASGRAKVVDALIGAGIDVDAAREAGAVSLRPPEGTYLHRGEFDADRTIGLFEGLTDSATDAGHEGVYVVGETAWLRDRGVDLDEWCEYERRVNVVFDERPAVGRCLYDRSHFPSGALSEAVRAHPTVAGGADETPRSPTEPSSVPSGGDSLDRGPSPSPTDPVAPATSRPVAAGEETAVTVALAVAEATDTDPLALSPVYEAVDPDALHRLFSARAAGERSDGRVAFPTNGCWVVVRADGRVDVAPRDELATQPSPSQVEFYRAEHEWDGDRHLAATLLQAIEGVSDRQDAGATVSLSEAVDPDALHRLFEPRDGGPSRDDGWVSFSFDRYSVTVAASGEITFDVARRATVAAVR